MTTTDKVHPQKDQLIAFGQGRLAADESSSVEQHLENCRECCETLLDLKDDTFVGLVKTAQPSDSDRRMGTFARPELECGKTESDKTGTGNPPKADHPPDAATLLVQSGEAVCVEELPAELRVKATWASLGLAFGCGFVFLIGQLANCQFRSRVVPILRSFTPSRSTLCQSFALLSHSSPPWSSLFRASPPPPSHRGRTSC